MKPRQDIETIEAEPVEVETVEPEASAEAGHEVPVLEPVLEGEEKELNDSPLEKVPLVVSIDLPTDLEAAIRSLQGSLEESKGPIHATHELQTLESSFVPPPADMVHTSEIAIYSGESFQELLDETKGYISLEDVLKQTEMTDVRLLTIDEIKRRYPDVTMPGVYAGESKAAENPLDAIMLTIPKIGPLPNGEYGLVVNIREGYWPGLEEQAKLDGVTPEEWASKIFSDYLESWFFGR